MKKPPIVELETSTIEGLLCGLIKGKDAIVSRRKERPRKNLMTKQGYFLYSLHNIEIVNMLFLTIVTNLFFH
jgi:hypothetical protein